MIYNYTFKNDKRMIPKGTIRFEIYLKLEDDFLYCHSVVDLFF